MPKPFAAVVSLQDRLSVVGSSDLLARVLPKHSPSSILPESWPARTAFGPSRFAESILGPLLASSYDPARGIWVPLSMLD